MDQRDVDIWHDLLFGPARLESENERRLRVLQEAKEHLDFCETDWHDRGEAAVTPFATEYWKDND